MASATMRVADPLIPQIADDLLTTPGVAAIIVTAFALAYGTGQLVWGPLGDRFGKFKVVAGTTLLASVLIAAPAFAGSILQLGVLRALGGAVAAAAIPLSMAFIGDHVAYDQRQAMLARFLTGQILGVIAGQAGGGVLGELMHWRTVFLLLGGLYFLVGLWLLLELRAGRLPPPVLGPARSPLRQLQAYADLLRRPWVRIVVVTVAIEAAAFYGGFAFVGAYAHEVFGLDFATVGIVLAFFGLGGFAYALSVGPLIRRLGERGLARIGGLVVALGFMAALLAPWAAVLPLAVACMGLGLYMLHNTLQTNATQMAPEARGLAVSTFAAALFLGQAVGVSVMGLVVDSIGYGPAFLMAAIGLISVGGGFASLLRLRPAAG